MSAGPCETWPVKLDCCTLPEDTDPELIERQAAVATHILWALSGRRWGLCTVTVRPCRQACDIGLLPRQWSGVQSTGGWVPYQDSTGAWRNASLCGCGPRGCSCVELCEVRLPGPVHDIVEVDLDGEVLLPTQYRLDAPGMLVRTDGLCWPDCQDMAAPTGLPGTWAVTYRRGLALDAAAIAAVSELTCQLVLACSPGRSGECRLPGRVTRVARRGVEMEMADPTLLFSEGRVGLPLCDMWLAAVNPGRLARPSRVRSPDYTPPRRTLWP